MKIEDIFRNTLHTMSVLDSSKRAAATGPECNRAAPEGSSPCDGASAASAVSSEPTMGDNGFASFSRDVKAIEANMLNTQQLLREATIELNVRQTLIEQYRSDKYAHQRLIGKLLELLNNDDLDTARNLVRDEFDAIHGPS